MWDVVCLGELFVDLVPHSKADCQWLYLPSPGGAPGNVAAGLAKLGHKTLMVSRVGDDAFGRLLVDALWGYGVDVSGIAQSAVERVGLSVVTLDGQGDRSFMFYRDQPADLNIDPDGLQPEWLAQTKILHLGVLPLSAALSAAAQRKAIDLAEANGKLISCDVNFRPALWSDAGSMLAAGREMISRSAIVKVSVDELRALNGIDDIDEAVQALWHKKIRCFSVTRGAEGAVLYTPAGKFECMGVKVAAIDTTGAGDAYTASLLSGMLDEVEPKRLLRMACVAGALATCRKGAMASLPTKAEVFELFQLAP
jgi:fructokinase